MSSIKFSFVCRKTFDELKGDDQIKRFCDDCQKEVINFDALTQKQQQAYLTAAKNAGEQLCISITQPLQHPVKILSCVERHRPTWGMAKLGVVTATSTIDKKEMKRKFRGAYALFYKPPKL
jgi:hypothetical protein